MAQIPSDKPLKKCPYCGKEVRNLGFHVANLHPAVMEKISEENETPSPSPAPPTLSPALSTSAMVREKLETMLNIKLIQMLEKGATIEDINRMMNPHPTPQTSPLEDLKKLLELQRLITPQTATIAGEMVEPAFDWAGLIKEGLPIIAQMLQNKNKNNMESAENGFNTGGFEETSVRIPELISAETSNDRNESSDASEKSSDNIRTIESADVSDAGTSERP